MGNKAQRGKTQPCSRTGDRALTAAARRAAEAAGPQCGARDPHRAGASRPRRTEQPARAGRQEAAPAPRARPAPRCRGASSIPQGGRNRPRAAGSGLRTADSAPPGAAFTRPGALTRLCAHPGAGGVGRRSVSPEVAGSAEQGRRRGRGERGDQQAAPGRARRRGARLLRGRLGSVVPGRAEAGPLPVAAALVSPHLNPRRPSCGCPFPESAS